MHAFLLTFMNNQKDPAPTSAEELGRESSNREPDDILRQLLRKDESKGDPDDRDVAGTVEHKDTAHGREETKNKLPGADKVNG